MVMVIKVVSEVYMLMDYMVIKVVSEVYMLMDYRCHVDVRSEISYDKPPVYYTSTNTLKVNKQTRETSCNWTPVIPTHR